MNPPAGSGRVVLARIGAPHGIKGEVRLKPFTADPDSLAAYGPLETRDGRSFIIERLRPAGPMLIAKLKGVDDRTQAETLNGAELTIDRARLPEPEDAEEFYQADLIGLEAVGTDGAPLGTVVAVHDFGAGDIIEIAPPGRRGESLLVPFTWQAVPEIDLVGGRIVVDPPAEIEATGEDGETGR